MMTYQETADEIGEESHCGNVQISGLYVIGQYQAQVGAHTKMQKRKSMQRNQAYILQGKRHNNNCLVGRDNNTLTTTKLHALNDFAETKDRTEATCCLVVVKNTISTC